MSVEQLCTIIAALMLASCVSVHAQFGVEQPIFSGQAPSGGEWTPQSVTNLAYWWKKESLSDGASSWTDVVQGCVITNQIAGTIKVDEIGPFFNGSVIMTNRPGFAVTSNTVVCYSYNPIPNFIGGGYLDMSLGLGGVGASEYGLEINYNSAVTIGAVSTDSAWAYNGGTFLSPQWTPMIYRSACLVLSNDIAGGDVTGRLYTNGVFSGSMSLNIPVTSIHLLGSYRESPLSGIEGYVSDVAIYTNITDFSAHVVNFHSFATSRIPTVHYSAPRQFMTNSLAGTTPGHTGNIANYGFWFIPWRDMTITHLGRWCYSGNSETHTVLIVRKSDAATMTSVAVNLSGATTNDWAYVATTNTVTLEKRNVYYIGSDVTNAGDTCYVYGSMLADYNSEGVVGGRWLGGSSVDGTIHNGGCGLNFKYQ